MGQQEKNPIVNVYEFKIEGLEIKHFCPNQEWLDFVVDNRNMEEPLDFIDYDLLIGPTADDKLFSTIEQYEAGFLSIELAVKVLNCMKYSEQYVFKNEKSLNNLKFLKALELDEPTCIKMITENKKDRKLANELTEQIIKNENRTKKTIRRDKSR